MAQVFEDAGAWIVAGFASHHGADFTACVAAMYHAEKVDGPCPTAIRLKCNGDTHVSRTNPALAHQAVITVCLHTARLISSHRKSRADSVS
jgi:hypothetical protein